MIRSAVLLMVAVLAGCAATSEEGASFSREPITLCIENATAGYGNVNAKARMTDFEVMSGHTVCKNLNEFGPAIPISARTRGGGAFGSLRFYAQVDPFRGNCWHWRLTNDRQTVPMHCVPEPEDEEEDQASADTTGRE